MSKFNFLTAIYLLIGLSAQCCGQLNTLSIHVEDTITTVLDSKKDYKYIEIFYDSSHVKESGYLLKNEKTGNWITNFSNGVILNFAQYDHNEKNGIYLECEKSGAIAVQEFYKNGKLNGEQKKYTTSKNTRIIKSIAHYKNDLYNGMVTEYDDDGKPQTEVEYIAGKRNGISRWYFSNERIAMEQNYLNDALNGTAVTYNKQGTVILKGTYTNNKKAGTWEEYYDTGIIKDSGTYINDVQTGEWKYYDESGNVSAIKLF